MKRFYLLAFLALATACFAQKNPEDEIPVFNLNSFYVPPKMTISVGMRMLTGAKVSFSGNGTVASTQGFGLADATNILRNYHDGYVAVDTRTDANGNPITPTDGMTNTWMVTDPRQLSADNSTIFMHAYSALGTDTAAHDMKPGLGLGTELLLARDMGHITPKLQWQLFAGLSLNGINGAMSGTVPATMTTVTDSYALNGQTPPTTFPYTSPVKSSVVNPDGTTTTTTVSYLLLGQKPGTRTITTTTTTLDEAWKLKGTFATLRLGPTLTYSFTDKFLASISVGPALIYSGTTYTVSSTLHPPTSDDIVATFNNTMGKLLTGYYVDATLRYLLTDTTGLYMGAFYQGGGDYDQAIDAGGATYTTRVDLDQLQGFRAGLTYKF